VERRHDRCARGTLGRSRGRRAARADHQALEGSQSTIGTIKAELLDGASPDDIHAVQRELFPYIESFYNRRRLHSTLGYITPSDKELLAISDRQVA
jgi:transposase InsO family protein